MACNERRFLTMVGGSAICGTTGDGGLSKSGSKLLGEVDERVGEGGSKVSQDRTVE